MYKMGVELIRLYDWDPRNGHQYFSIKCKNIGIGVLVSVSNYNLSPTKVCHVWKRQYRRLSGLFRTGTDYHPAVQGIVIGNEYNREDNISMANVAAFTNTWASIEGGQFGDIGKS